MLASTTSRNALLGVLSLAVAGGVPLGLAAAPASAVDGVIEAVTCEGEVGGYTPYLQFGCNLLRVTVTDSTPSAAGDYNVGFDGTTHPSPSARVTRRPRRRSATSTTS